jgi:thiol:disulfide interchange protein DsbC
MPPRIALSLGFACALATASYADVPATTAQTATVAPTAAAAAPAVPAASVADPRAQIATKIPGTRVEDLRATPVPGIYELARGTEIAYVTADGKYAFSGDLIEVAPNHNLTEVHRRELREKAIDAIPESEMLVFSPRDPKYTVTVFTDVDCGYCRQLHSQIAQYNQLGIKVRYLFYPRSGPNTESWTKAEEVWCSNNRNEALTLAKRGAPLQAKVCPNNPVARHYALGRSFGLEGTPAIVAADGELIGGYMPPADLMQHLRTATAANR